MFVFTCPQAVANERFEQLAVVDHPGLEVMNFLDGNWISTDPDIRIMESWSSDRGNFIGMRRLLLPGTNARNYLYYFFAAEGKQMRMRRMNVFLRNLDSKKEEDALCTVAAHSEYANKATLEVFPQYSADSPKVPLMIMRYSSPKGDLLDLEIETKEDGKPKTELYHLKRLGTAK
jgi:hypothetical protein